MKNARFWAFVVVFCLLSAAEGGQGLARHVFGGRDFGPEVPAAAVEAKGDKPAEPEKVQASHILLKTAKVQDVPKKEDVLKFAEKRDERSFMQDFVQKQIKAAKIEASEDYKRFLPPTDEPKAKPVETPAAK